MTQDRPRNPPPAWLVRAVVWARCLFRSWSQRIVPPEMVPCELVAGLAWAHALGAIVRAGIPDTIGDATLTAEAIAMRSGLDPDLVHRSLRALSAVGVFRMDRAGRFSNSPSTHALRRGHPSGARDFVVYFTSRSNVAAWGAFDWTLRTGGSAFEHVHGVSVWEWFDRHPEERETFAAAMAGMTRADAPTIATLYPFGEIDCLCDVGGGRGVLLSEILLRHPKLRGMLCDAPGVLDAARPWLEASGVAHRVTLVPGSFFEQVPRGADAYLLKNVLHDWDDAKSVEILRAVRAAAGDGPGQRLLVVESLVSRTSEDPASTATDIQMAVACLRGRERDESEFHRLFVQSGFQPGRTFRAPLIAVLEATAVPHL
jgi:multifunctional cyclase/dehydratase/O-methyltransferase